MRDFPIAKLKCKNCGKEISLYDDDFFVVLDKSEKEWHEFYYTCPRCGEASKYPSCFVPTYLKDRLVMAEKKRIDEEKIKIKLLKLPVFFGIGIIAIFVVLSLMLIFQ